MPPALKRIERSIDNHPVRAFFLLTVVYFVAVATLSFFKLLWLDELITLHIARLGSASAIWAALANGADPNPPVVHLLVHLSRSLFGEREFALRLPAILGYWLGLLSLFLFLRRHLSATWALGGTFLSMAMAAFEYSYESRSYGIFYGLAMFSFFCWTRAADPASSPARQRLAVFGLGLGLALGISTNYFAVLAFFPVAAGELARTFRRFQITAGIRSAIDLRIWATLVLAATPLLLFRHMIQHSIAQFAPHAWNKVSIDQAYNSYTEMVESLLYPTLAMIAALILVLFLARLCPSCRSRMRPRWLGDLATHHSHSSHPTLPPQEAVGVLFLMAYPLLGFVVASIHGGMLSPRFVIPVCFGFAIAATFATFRLFGHYRFASLVLLLVSVAWFVAREGTIGYWYSEQKQSFYKILEHLPNRTFAGKTIVIPDPLLALTFEHYAPAEVVSRTVFPVDFPAIRLWRGDDSPEQNLWAGRNTIYHLPIVTVAELQKKSSQYLMITSDGNWLVQDLIHHRYPVDRLPVNARAGAIGGFTPLCRGNPVFYTSVGEQFFRDTPGFHLQPLPFQAAHNVPDAKVGAAVGGPFDDPHLGVDTDPSPESAW